MNIKILLLGCLGLSVFLSACGTAPKVTPSEHYGIFQNRDGKLATPSQNENSGSVPESFIWPIESGSVSSPYGKRRRDFHDGIDIRSPKGTPIRAAKSGLVVYSSRRIKGYGNMIVIRHEDGTSTVYAHNQKNLVKRTDAVKQGDVIAYVGRTGKATGYHLHFEVRQGESPQNPLLHLPQIQSVAGVKKETF